MLYADSSALVKLVLSEPESELLRAVLDSHGTTISSSLVVTELVRATRRARTQLERQASGVLSALYLIEVDEAILTAAGVIGPVSLRSLDAIHLASALTLGPELDALVTYDVRMAEAAREAGLIVQMPT